MNPGPKRRLPARARWIAAAAVAVGVAAAYAGRLKSDPVAQIAAATIVRRDIESAVVTSGLVVPVHDFLARATNGGTVQKVLVHLGDHVQAGQLMVLMKDPYAESRVSSAVASLRAYQVGMENTDHGGSQDDRISFAQDLQRMQGERASAERNLATLTTLLESGAASEAEVAAAQRRLGGAEQNLKTQQQRMTGRYSPREATSWKAKVQEGQAIVKAERLNLGNVHIVSTITGTAYLVPANENDFVAPGAELVHVADLSQMQVRADFDEADAAKLRVGEPVLLRWEAKPASVWHGSIERAPLAFTGNGARRVGLSIISVQDAKGDLPPASTVTVRAFHERHGQVPTLPREALHVEGDARFVYLVVRDRLVRVPVETGIVTPDLFEVVRGISANDQVALHSLDYRDLLPGEHVEIVR